MSLSFNILMVAQVITTENANRKTISAPIGKDISAQYSTPQTSTTVINPRTEKLIQFIITSFLDEYKMDANGVTAKTQL